MSMINLVAFTRYGEWPNFYHDLQHAQIIRNNFPRYLDPDDVVDMDPRRANAIVNQIKAELSAGREVIVDGDRLGPVVRLLQSSSIELAKEMRSRITIITTQTHDLINPLRWVNVK